MKLYLSSFRLGDRAQDLARMVAGGRRIGVVRNALDFSSDAERLEGERAREFKDLFNLELIPEELDLRRYFGRLDSLEKFVARFDALWVVGGNSFILRRAMRESGFEEVISRRSEDPDFVYAGYSAGACVMGPTLRGINLVDDPTVVPAGYSEPPVWEGLSFVPFAIAPHYRSRHPESGLIEDVIAHYISDKIPFIVLRDGEVYVSDAK